MKPSALRIERMLEKIEAKLVPPERKSLRAIIHEGDAEAVVKEKQEKALAEYVARHPEGVRRTVEDFNWILSVIVKWPREAGDPPLSWLPGSDKDSQKRQSAAIAAYAKAHGYRIVDEFNDAAVSGSDPAAERPGFKAMLDRIAGNGES
jgi:hypothetical protein